MSQYFGDMESYKVFRTFLQAAEHMEKLFGMVPGAVACDLHPGYATAGRRHALRKKGSAAVSFQHHHAHAASVMAEHGLRRCIAVVFDGTGYGTDGTVWGGEFLLCEGGSFLRAGHLEETELAGGDFFGKGCRAHRSLPSFIRPDVSFRREKQENDRPEEELREKMVRATVSNHINTEKSSSMGRLFDAVSALLGIREYNSYEGECAIALENAARAIEKNAAPPELYFPIREEEENTSG